jgi:N-acetyltransferase
VTFDSQPVLRGELVELRPLRPEDYDGLYAVAADPLIWEQHPARNRHEAAIFQTLFQEWIQWQDVLQHCGWAFLH